MGPAVNRTAHLESLTKQLGQSICVSKEFAELVGCPMLDLGQHQMKGIEQQQAVFAPDESCG